MSERSTKLGSITAIIFVTALLLAIPVASVVATNSSSKNFAELVWGNNAVYSMVAPPSPIPHPGNIQGQEDFYEEAPQVASMGFPFSPQSSACEHLGIVPGTNTTGCWHDHTLGTVPGQTGFRALWHVKLVVCAGNAASSSNSAGSCTSETVTGTLFSGQTVTLHLAKVVTFGSTPTPLTSGPVIESAEALGIVTVIDTGTTFICPVQPFSG